MERQWIIRLTDESANRAGSARDALGQLQQPVLWKVLKGLGIKGQILVESRNALDVNQVVAALEKDPNVDYFHPNTVHSIQKLPGDPMFTNLYGLHNTGQTRGTEDADINAPEAWDITTGSRTVVIGIIDTGIDYTHPDLAENIWTNPGEIPDNHIDDDGNGLVDDYYGYNFIFDESNPYDDNSHGTHVAGTIGALGNNSLGVTGINWQVSMMALKILTKKGYTSTDAAVRAINYVTMMRDLYGINVKATNNSWGNGDYEEAMREAIATGGEKDILFITAAGNDGRDNDAKLCYPASYDLDCIIAVAATDKNDELWTNSNYGVTSVDLAAPGVAILSTFPENSYNAISGTSMATPYVTGVAALAWAHSPDASMAEVKNAILGGVDILPSLTGKTLTGGRLNALKTLQRLDLAVTDSTPEHGNLVTMPLLEFTLQFSAAVAADSITAGEFKVNNIPASNFNIVADDCVTFVFASSPVNQEGPQQMTLAGGGIRRADKATAVHAWEGHFFYDQTPMQLLNSTPADQAILPAPPTRMEFVFSKPLLAASIDVDDLWLSKGRVVSVSQPSASSIVFTLAGISGEGIVSYAIAKGSLADALGNPNPEFQGQ
ncbi:MAG TPA: S8 family peptidase, partial [Lentisphaeria bacterium]|nr:S8 family peptidase [Lentisphaeria bacterium]